MSAELALRTPSGGAAHLTNLPLGDLFKLGKMLTGTGFLPTAIKTPEQAMAVMIKGQELRVPPMYALSNIAIIQGKPACTAELMLALIYRDHGDDAARFETATNAQATISYKRRNWRERRTFTFSAQDARTAGLTGGNWTKYPGAMLRARCISAVARLAFPDSIAGMHLPEELGAVTDAESGEIVPPVDNGAARLDLNTGDVYERTDPDGDESGPVIGTRADDTPEPEADAAGRAADDVPQAALWPADLAPEPEVEPVEVTPDTPKTATFTQLDTIRRLSEQVGRVIEHPEQLSRNEAGQLITELGRARQPQRAGARS